MTGEAPPSTARPSSLSRLMPMLRCRFGARDYLVPVGQVLEITPYVRPTPVPGTALWIVGIMNLRGRIHPVVDLAIKFGEGPTAVSEQACIVLVQPPAGMGDVPIGVLTGRVAAIHELRRGDLDPPKRGSTSLRPEFVAGVFRTDEGAALALNLEKVLAAEEVVAAPIPRESD